MLLLSLQYGENKFVFIRKIFPVFSGPSLPSSYYCYTAEVVDHQQPHIKHIQQCLLRMERASALVFNFVCVCACVCVCCVFSRFSRMLPFHFITLACTILVPYRRYLCLLAVSIKPAGRMKRRQRSKSFFFFSVFFYFFFLLLPSWFFVRLLTYLSVSQRSWWEGDSTINQAI